MQPRAKTALFFLISVLFRNHFCAAADALLSGQSLTPGQTLISKDGIFELGFFQLGNSQNYYIAIWYKKIPVQNKTNVWIANRNAPLALDLYYSKLKLLENGNLVLYSGPETVVWSTNTTSNAMNSSQAVLGDDGNFVLRNEVTPFDVYWQSFDHLSDTWLPGGRIKYDNITKKSQLLTSWRNQNDPSEGLFSMELDPSHDAYIIRRNHSEIYWSSGPWNGQIFIDVPEMRLNYIYNFSYAKNAMESHFTYNVYNASLVSRFVMDLSGQIKMLIWDAKNQQWFLFWSQPRQGCEVYALCGAYSVCSTLGLPTCKCMKGFRPQFQIDWDIGDFSGGCVREKPLRCGVGDSLLPMHNVTLPEDPVSLAVGSAEQCRSACFNSCSCSAYAYNTKCSIWNGNLLQVQQLSEGDGSRGILNLRLADRPVQNSGGESKSADSADKRKKKSMKAILLISIFVGLLTVGLCIFICKRWINKQKGQRNTGVVVHGTSNSNRDRSDSKMVEEPDVPMFKYEILVEATVNFDLANKLGEGGFGSVYKGKLPSGEEIAVKRLSQSSGQGTEEFKNEVTVISGLQHRNLVRLLGFCIKGDEKMLIYECMPNKSLDVFLFDPTRKTLLGWRKCFQIIEGIARGILYLHRDSRLRVIHRDIKPSNILLDKDLNPKIADFGMARIVGGDELQANTRRVVGTYGYMSPEYAMDGLFSEKSDVYSFGVLILEIVTGMKNTGFYYHQESISLIQHVWKSWNKDKPEEFLDPTISEPCFEKEMLRCIQLGLLCVQEFPKDRPNMSSIISMLTSEITALPTPKQPAFTARPVNAEANSSYCSHKNCSTNNVSITSLEGR